MERWRGQKHRRRTPSPAVVPSMRSTRRRRFLLPASVLPAAVATASEGMMSASRQNRVEALLMGADCDLAQAWWSLSP